MMTDEVVSPVDRERDGARVFMDCDAWTATRVAEGVWIKNVSYVESLVGWFRCVSYQRKKCISFFLAVRDREKNNTDVYK
jgi:hypothetical protein